MSFMCWKFPHSLNLFFLDWFKYLFSGEMIKISIFNRPLFSMLKMLNLYLVKSILYILNKISAHFDHLLF